MQRVFLATAFFLGLAGQAAARDLEIFFIDVEGGQATLVVTPAGQSLLIDAGYGGNRGPRDAERILAVARDQARLERIDYLLVTHFHPDHVGGVPSVIAGIPIGTFIDYGEPTGTDRMSGGGFRAYEPLRAGHPHIVPQPGDKLPFEGLDTIVLSAAGELVANPLSGAGRTNPACASLEDHVEDGTENYRSIGIRLAFGDFRFVDLGDLSGNTLGKLVCPIDRVGEASVYLVAHHGNYDANVPAVVAALRPQAAILNNGAIKGGVADSFATLRAQPGMDLWQLHESRNDGALNSPADFIANVDDGATAFYLKLTARQDGSFEIANSRTGFVKRYPAPGDPR